MRSMVRQTGRGLRALLRRFVAGRGEQAGRPRVPIVTGLDTVSGSFPPLNEWDVTGRREDYYLHAGYQSRKTAEAYTGHEGRSEWQGEVYRYAREIALQYSIKSICDVGCGSGYKLVKYFSQFSFVGLDTPAAVELLRKNYPTYTWLPCDFGTAPPIQPNLVISADVIEHLLQPELLLQYIVAMRPDWVVLSTPDRNLLRMGTHNGPPTNPSHYREWNMTEFRSFVGEYMDIVEHFISSASQCTQCILARPFPSATDAKPLAPARTKEEHGS
jgi:hypothetical protein